MIFREISQSGRLRRGILQGNQMRVYNIDADSVLCAAKN
jgi:hypothetical protein